MTLDFAANTATGSWANNDIVDGFEGASGSKTGNDILLGTDGTNLFRGYGGDDWIDGRGGDDRIIGGTGNDTLTGGAGADHFVFKAGDGNDRVLDFDLGLDTLQLDGYASVTDAASALTFASQIGADVQFDFGAEGSILVQNVTLALLLDDLAIV